MKRVYSWLAVGACAAAGLASMTSPRQAGAAPPAGFKDTLVLSGLVQPTAIDFAPDGRMFILEKGGRVRIVKNGQLLPTPFMTLSVDSFFERGLLGIAFDPNFSSNRFLYLYYTTSPNSLNPPPKSMNRVSRFTANGDTVLPGSERILVDRIPSDAGNHNAGCLRFGPEDGKLYISTGDGGQFREQAQSLTNLAGKILRINPDGSIPGDNPFAGRRNQRGEIYCYGLRNPWRFNFREDGTLYIGDVGQNTWEEVNVGQAGANYGWPLTEGPTNDSRFVGPLYAYDHRNGGASITGGCFIPSNSTVYPAGYRGAYIFGDYVQNFIKRLVVSGDNRSAQPFQFLDEKNDPTVERTPVDFKIGPDGFVYYVNIFTEQGGEVRKITYAGSGNRPPVASSTADRRFGPLPLTVRFSSAGSSDPDGDRISYRWNFGDGTTSSLANPTKRYTRRGTFQAILEVSDARGAVTRAAPIVIVAGARPPTVSITAPLSSRLFSAGELITFTGRATDSTGRRLTGASLDWDIRLFHTDHFHPAGDATGESGQFRIPTQGEPSADVAYDFTLTATDANGLTASRTVRIRPRVVALTFASSPAGVPLTLNGQPIQTRTPFRVNSVVGFEHVVSAPAMHMGGGHFMFSRWSDGGARTHTIRAPATATTYTAFFNRE